MKGKEPYAIILRSSAMRGVPMKFTKMQGAGNDFVVVEASGKRCDWSRLAIAMCDRHYGIGADGLLLVSPSKTADCAMRVFNSDGTEAEACGNGTRCLVKYVADNGLVSAEAQEIAVATMAGVRKARVHRSRGKVTRVTVAMGEPKFGSSDIPVAIDPRQGSIAKTKSMINYTINVDGERLSLNLVSMGNPHAVCFSANPVSDFPLLQLGPKVERHDIFPKRANFEIVQVLNRKEIEARVWERGAGETLACGSGACAIAVAGQLLGYVDSEVSVKLPGGTLKVAWDGTGEVFLSGAAEIVFSGEWPD